MRTKDNQFNEESKDVTFISKGQDRIFVFNEEHVNHVKSIIERIDPFEYEYLRNDFITMYKKDINDLVYTGKFSISIPRLIHACAAERIGILCRSTRPVQPLLEI